MSTGCILPNDVAPISKLLDNIFVLLNVPTSNKVQKTLMSNLIAFVNNFSRQAVYAVVAEGENPINMTDAGTVSYAINVIEAKDGDGNNISWDVTEKTTNSFKITVPAAGYIIYKLEIYV